MGLETSRELNKRPGRLIDHLQQSSPTIYLHLKRTTRSYHKKPLYKQPSTRQPKISEKLLELQGKS